MMGLLPYQQSPFGQIADSAAPLISTILAMKHMRDMHRANAVPLGEALGYNKAPDTLPTAGPVGPTGIPPAPVVNPVAGTWPGAPESLQPLLSRPVGELGKLKSILGDTQTGNILGAMGIGKNIDPNQLEYDQTTNTFKLKTGVKSPTVKTAGLIIRQKELKNKEDLTKWRDAAMRRLDQAQLTNEERVALNADSNLLNFMVSPQFDLLDDTIKNNFNEQATAAVNRLQQRGVKVYTGTRAKKTQTQPTTGTPNPQPMGAPMTPEAKFNQLKMQNPNLTDQEIYAQMAIEEASGK